MTLVRLVAAMGTLGCLSACGGDDVIRPSCDEPQRYQRVVAGKRIEVPDDLDSLNEFAEMPIPRSEGARVRPPGSPCIELPPLAGTSK